LGDVTAGVLGDGNRWYFTKGRGCVGVCYVPVLSSPTGESIALTIILRGTVRGDEGQLFGKNSDVKCRDLGWIIVLLFSPIHRY
jgi:hypothetical protein